MVDAGPLQRGKIPDPIRFFRRLRFGGQRRGEDGRQCADELPPRGHWITSSAAQLNGGRSRDERATVHHWIT